MSHGSLVVLKVSCMASHIVLVLGKVRKNCMKQTNAFTYFCLIQQQYLMCIVTFMFLKFNERKNIFPRGPHGINFINTYLGGG